MLEIFRKRYGNLDIGKKSQDFIKEIMEELDKANPP